MKQTQAAFSDMSHVDRLTGARKRKKKTMDDLKQKAYQKALLDLIYVQATTGQLIGAPQEPPQQQAMDPAMMGGAPPPMQAPPMQGGMPPPMMGGMGG